MSKFDHIQHYKSNHIINTHLVLYDQIKAFIVYFGLLLSGCKKGGK